MAEHRVPKGNIIYIIPTDELFIKYKNNEAFIDEYGRLMNRKPHRVLKELKHYVADSEMQESYASSIKDLVRDKMVEYSKYAIDRVGDVFFYEVIPNVWHKHIVPLWNGAKDVLFSKELKIDQIKCETEYKVVENQSIFSETMTKEEVDAEKRKLLYHWIGLLSSLTKLRNAGELDVESTLAQLTEPMMIERVNALLGENPNLLETDKYILLHSLLGRDLYMEGQLIPIRAAEIKKVAKADTPADILFGSGSLLADIYGNDDDDSDVWDDASLIDNQRFKKLCRLPQLGVYVDEAHHLFGADLEKELRSGGANKTTLRNTINMLAASTSIVACYNYTGTPYVKKQVLPEVVYAYGLNESIAHGYLKDADPIGFENVKSEVFLRTSITKFWERYGGKTYEGLLPKLAIFAANVKEATDVVRPAVEKVLSELGISLSTVLVNTGDPSVTKDEDIKNFNNLDVIGTEGSKKQFIILVEKGREGWNCRSLLGIALFRSPKSKVFVLQATMRCLRQLTKEQLKATIFLSKENYDTLDDELRKNYNMEISDFGKSPNTNKKVYKVRVLPPPRSIKMKRLWHEYSLIEKEYSVPIDFHLAELDESKYEAKMYEKGSLRLGLSEKETNIDSMKEQERFSEFSLTAEISRYMNISCLTIAKILRESVDGSGNIVAAVNRHNEILEDVIIPEIFHTLYEVKSTQKSEDVDMVLLREPKDSGYYEFSANDELVITKGHNNFTPKEEAKSFHADTYCFDSKPEKECFLQYISSNKVKEISGVWDGHCYYPFYSEQILCSQS